MVLTCFLRRYLITSYSLLILHFSSLNTLSLEFGRLNNFLSFRVSKNGRSFFLFFDLLVIVLVMRVEDFERGRPRERMRRGVRRIVVKGTTIRVIHLNFRNIHPYRIKKPDKSSGQIIRTLIPMSLHVLINNDFCVANK